MSKRLPSPLTNDCLFSCPATLTTEQIVAALPLAGQPILDLSARQWAEEWRMANDLLRACGAPQASLSRPRARVNWASLEEWLYGNAKTKGHVTGGRLIGSQWVGEVFISRDWQPDGIDHLAHLVDWVYDERVRLSKKPHLVPPTTLAVVLAGWTAPTLEARPYGKRRSWVVNPLPGS